MSETQIDTKTHSSQLDKEISNAPFMWVERTVKEKRIRFLGRVVTLEDSQEGEFPFRVYDHHTKREIKLETDEEGADAYRVKGLSVPIDLTEKIRNYKNSFTQPTSQDKPQDQSLIEIS